jgi:hypothetical protein
MAGARQRETAARQEAGGAEPRNLPTDCPSAVSENGGDESRTHKHTCPQLYRRMAGSREQRQALGLSRVILSSAPNEEHQRT